MAHFAKIDENNIVQEIVVVHNNVLLDDNNNETEQQGIDFCKSLYGQNTNWVQTSYNGNFRKQFATIDGKYDSTKNKFIKPQPYVSWILNSNDDWEAPTAYPTDGNHYFWNESTLTWDIWTI